MNRGRNGVAGLMKRLEALVDSAEQAAADAAREAGETARARAAALAPVGDGSDGGHLRDCIRVELEQEAGGTVARVLAENPHAAYMEFGTGRRGASSSAPPKWKGAGGYSDVPGMPAQPYLAPALEEGRDGFLEDTARRLVEAIRSGRS